MRTRLPLTEIGNGVDPADRDVTNVAARGAMEGVGAVPAGEMSAPSTAHNAGVSAGWAATKLVAHLEDALDGPARPVCRRDLSAWSLPRCADQNPPRFLGAEPADRRMPRGSAWEAHK